MTAFFLALFLSPFLPWVNSELYGTILFIGTRLKKPEKKRKKKSENLYINVITLSCKQMQNEENGLHLLRREGMGERDLYSGRPQRKETILRVTTRSKTAGEEGWEIINLQSFSFFFLFYFNFILETVIFSFNFDLREREKGRGDNRREGQSASETANNEDWENFWDR